MADPSSPRGSSWARTLAIQAALCLALYAAFNVGRPQRLRNAARGGGEPLDLYFLSVRGGSRGPEEQTQLLRQMEKAAKIYKAKFVVNIAEHGQEDPLLQNATMHFSLSEIPWYITAASRGQVNGNFLKKIRIPYEQVLDIIAVDTGPLQDLLHTGQLSDVGSEQLHWIQKSLAATDGDWRIVIGRDPLIVCEENHATGMGRFYEPIRHIFIEYGVNAYLSQEGCVGYYCRDEGIAYIGNPGPGDNSRTAFSVNGNSEDPSRMRSGFLLHRVSPLEIVGIETYFIDSIGEIGFKSVLHQRGRDAM